jgi:oligopeptide/dipeptide ABC transporter ATP-binding protein
MSSPILTVEDLAIDVRGQRVLDGVSFAVDQGSVLGIVGETGSGKSMTCRALTGMLDRIGAHVVAGSVNYAGHDLVSLNQSGWRALRGRHIALISQSSISGLDPIMRVGRQLRESVRAHDSSIDTDGRSLELLEAVHIPRARDVLRKYPHELSGGTRQRVVIALALAGEPDLLIADEPTTALDVTVQRGILELLATLRRERRMTLVLITHDLDVVHSIADEVVVMYAGRTVETGSTESIFRRPAHPYSRALLAAQPSNAVEGQALVSLPGSPPVTIADRVGCAFAPRCPSVQPACTTQDVTAVRFERGTRSAACLLVEESSS